MNFKSSRIRRSLLKEQNLINFASKVLLPRSLRRIIAIFPHWLLCIPLSALIVIVWNTAASAQGLDAPASFEELKVVLDSIFLLLCSILVIFMNAGFGMLVAGFCRQKNAVNFRTENW